MNRSEFAAGKNESDEDKEKAKKAAIDAKKLGSTGKKMIGDGHAAAGRTLIPDAFIDKLDNYIPKK